jgi:hypothetical protein
VTGSQTGEFFKGAVEKHEVIKSHLFGNCSAFKNGVRLDKPPGFKNAPL